MYGVSKEVLVRHFLKDRLSITTYTQWLPTPWHMLCKFVIFRSPRLNNMGQRSIAPLNLSVTKTSYKGNENVHATQHLGNALHSLTKLFPNG